MRRVQRHLHRVDAQLAAHLRTRAAVSHDPRSSRGLLRPVLDVVDQSASMFQATAFDQPHVCARTTATAAARASVRVATPVPCRSPRLGLDTWDVENVNRMSSIGDGTEAGDAVLNAATMERVAALVLADALPPTRDLAAAAAGRIEGTAEVRPAAR